MFGNPPFGEHSRPLYLVKSKTQLSRLRKSFGPSDCRFIAGNYRRLRTRPRRDRSRTSWWFPALTLLFVIAASTTATVALAQPLTCGGLHRVERGDTLFKIADRAYGDGWLFKKIFQANRDLLPDEASVEIGQELLIPCLDGRGPARRLAALSEHSVTLTADESPTSADLLGGLGQPRQTPEQSGVERPVNRRAVRSTDTPCTTFHTVTRGETLFKIAAREYGDGWLYKRIFQANRDLLPDESAVEIGQELLIPCLDGSGPATRQEALAWAAKDNAQPSVGNDEPSFAITDPAPESVEMKGEAPLPLAAAVSEVARWALLSRSGFGGEFAIKANASDIERTPAAGDPEALASLAKSTQRINAGIGSIPNPTPDPSSLEPAIRILTGAVPAPFAGESLKGGGMLTELVTNAIEAADGRTAFQIGYDDNWVSHLTMRDGTFDMSFPWYKPDCSNLTSLDPPSRWLCIEFDFTRPLIEEPVGFYVRKGEALVRASDLGALEGHRICRPNGPVVFGVDQIDLGPAKFLIESPDRPSVCWERLMRGDADVVMMLKRHADRDLYRLGILNEIDEAEQLAATQLLHGIVPKKNTRGDQILDLVNRGLDRVMLSGEWFRIVSFHNRQAAVAAD